MDCQHGPAKRLEVKKPGSNQGRIFYACGQPQGSQCDFFCWEGETPNTVQNRTPQRDELIGKVLASINTKIDRIEASQQTIIDMLNNMGSSATPEPSNKKVPF